MEIVDELDAECPEPLADLDITVYQERRVAGLVVEWAYGHADRGGGGEIGRRHSSADIVERRDGGVPHESLYRLCAHVRSKRMKHRRVDGRRH